MNNQQKLKQSKEEKIGLESFNNFGSLMKIINYRKNYDIDVYFPEYNYTTTCTYVEFKRGTIKCPYEPRLYGIGYLGEGEFDSSSLHYIKWNNMMQRCYDENVRQKNKTYKNCTVCEEWHCYQNFARWHEEHYYEVSNEVMCLDKDILIKNNKEYNPDTCIYVPNTINVLFTKNNANRGELPIGVQRRGNKYRAALGSKKSSTCATIEEAFNIYKDYKETEIKRVADEYKLLIPEALYNALYDYQVDIFD